MRSQAINPTHLLEIESERAYVVYDPQSGSIVHVHRTMTFRGAKELSKEQDEARAIELARQFGHQVGGLRVLCVEPSDLDPHSPQVVDLGSLRLARGRPAEVRP